MSPYGMILIIWMNVFDPLELIGQQNICSTKSVSISMFHPNISWHLQVMVWWTPSAVVVWMTAFMNLFVRKTPTSSLVPRSAKTQASAMMAYHRKCHSDSEIKFWWQMYPQNKRQAPQYNEIDKMQILFSNYILVWYLCWVFLNHDSTLWFIFIFSRLCLEFFKR